MPMGGAPRGSSSGGSSSGASSRDTSSASSAVGSSTRSAAGPAARSMSGAAPGVVSRPPLLFEPCAAPRSASGSSTRSARLRFRCGALHVRRSTGRGVPSTAALRALRCAAPGWRSWQPRPLSACGRRRLDGRLRMGSPVASSAASSAAASGASGIASGTASGPSSPGSSTSEAYRGNPWGCGPCVGYSGTMGRRGARGCIGRLHRRHREHDRGLRRSPLLVDLARQVSHLVEQLVHDLGLRRDGFLQGVCQHRFALRREGERRRAAPARAAVRAAAVAAPVERAAGCRGLLRWQWRRRLEHLQRGVLLVQLLVLQEVHEVGRPLVLDGDRLVLDRLLRLLQLQLLVLLAAPRRPAPGRRR